MIPEFSAYGPARLLEARDLATEQVRLVVEPPPGFAAAHRHAGQFCRMRVRGEEGIFAMWSPPGEEPIRFLVRVGTPDGAAANALASLDDGASIEMSAPAGEGFRLGELGGDLVFVATGTGVAPVCAALERVIGARDRWDRVMLIHGVQTEAHVAIEGELPRWADAGIEWRIAYSRVGPGGALVGETVQDVLRREHPDLSQASVVGVGQPEMLADLLKVVVELGGSEVRFFTNL